MCSKDVVITVMFADEVYQQRHSIGGVDYEHREMKLVAGHFDYTGCVHLVLWEILNLGISKINRVVSTQDMSCPFELLQLSSVRMI